LAKRDFLLLPKRVFQQGLTKLLYVCKAVSAVRHFTAASRKTDWKFMAHSHVIEKYPYLQGNIG
jgi:hypothetical protein